MRRPLTAIAVPGMRMKIQSSIVFLIAFIALYAVPSLYSSDTVEYSKFKTALTGTWVHVNAETHRPYENGLLSIIFYLNDKVEWTVIVDGKKMKRSGAFTVETSANLFFPSTLTLVIRIIPNEGTDHNSIYLVNARVDLDNRFSYDTAVLKLRDAFYSEFLLINENHEQRELNSTTAPEYEVYSDVLSELKWFSDEKNVLVIRQGTTCDKFSTYDAKIKLRIKENLGPELDNSLFEEFGKINAQSIILKEQFRSSLSVILLSKEEENQLFNPIDSGWKQFYEKYPKSSGIIEVSRVAFNENRTTALLCCGTVFDRGKGGIGYYILLKKQDGKWIIEKKVMAWIA